MVSCSLFHAGASAQVLSASEKRMVIGLSARESFDLEGLSARFNQMDGVRLTAYCANLHCIVLDFDTGKFNSPEDVMEAIRSMKVTASLKHNTTLDPLTTDCLMMSQNSNHSEH